MSTPHLRYALYPGMVRSQSDGDIHHIGFAELCKLYNVPPALCVDMSRPENRVGRDLSNLIALRPSYSGNYTLSASERGACPWDTNGDGDCHRCFIQPSEPLPPVERRLCRFGGDPSKKHCGALGMCLSPFC